MAGIPTIAKIMYVPKKGISNNIFSHMLRPLFFYNRVDVAEVSAFLVII